MKLDGDLLTLDADYTISYSNNVNVGSGIVKVTGKGKFTGVKEASFKIAKASNSAKVAKTTVQKALKAKALRKKARLIDLPKVATEFGKAQWKVVEKARKKALTLKGGKVKVKKGARKGTYTLKLKAQVADTANYRAAQSKPVTVKVTVK